jgi:hypothetical protein
MNHRAHVLAPNVLRAFAAAMVTCAMCAGPRTASAAPADAASAVPANAARVHVRGLARIDAHATKGSGRLLVTGRVTDDTAIRSGDAAPAAMRLSLRIAQATGGRPVALASTAPESCQGSSARPVLASPEELVLPTDPSGRFCVQVTLPVDRYVAHLEVPSSDRVDGSSLDLPLYLALQPVTLTFDGAPALSLDDETTSVAVRAREQDPTSGQSIAARDLALSLWNEGGAALGDATTDSGGQALFVVPAARLGPPGRGELRVSFAGNATASPASASRAVERRTSVVVNVADATEGKLPEASADDVAIGVVATAACAAHGCKALPSGTIELRMATGSGAVIVGAAALERGAARVVARFNPLDTPPAIAELTIRYVADAPWFEPPADRAVAVPIRPRGPWSSAILVAAGAAVLVWLAVARFPFASRWVEPAESQRASAAREPAPRVELVRPGDAGQWVGRVVDAHDATPIAHARVAIERPAFRDVRVIVEGTSDVAGAFALRSDATIAGDELVVESKIHAVVRRPVPAPGEIEVALVQRRRLLIDQLVAWAKRRGRPFDARPEPTPAHVRRAAARVDFALEQRAQALRIEQWAEAVEIAVYGGAPVDARAQVEVERLGPADASKPADTAAEPEASGSARSPRAR